jgi:ABC-type branched-subunit amino acid transport system substrate-binding protein
LSRTLDANLEAMAMFSQRSPTIDVGLPIPLQGPAGIFGPSCELCALLATEEINLENGVLGRELRLRRIDAGQSPSLVAENVSGLVKQGRLDAVVGWHLSSVRQAVAPRISGRVPYIYTAL